jgi:uncharacterized membrane protein YgcG
VRTGAAVALNALTAHNAQPTAFFFLLCDVLTLLPPLAPTVLAVPVAPYPAAQTQRLLSLSSAPETHAVHVREGERPLCFERLQRVQAASALLQAFPVRVLVVVVVVVVVATAAMGSDWEKGGGEEGGGEEGGGKEGGGEEGGGEEGGAGEDEFGKERRAGRH